MTASTDQTAPAVSYTYEKVQAALNRAADDVLTAVDAPDSGTRDTVNLLVNAAGAYLTGAASDLADVAAGYDIDDDELAGVAGAPRSHLDVIVGWCTGQ